MYTEKDMQQEISEIVNGKILRKVAIPADAITLTIIRNYVPDFSRGSTANDFVWWTTVRKAVGNYLARITKNEDGDLRQLRLPGFNYIQRAYVVKRDDQDTAVPSEKVTDEEFILIAERLTKEGLAKQAHAKEIYEYIEDRSGSLVANKG